MEKEKLETGISTDRKARERKKEMSVSLDKETCLGGKSTRKRNINVCTCYIEGRREKDETEWWKMTKQR